MEAIMFINLEIILYRVTLFGRPFCELLTINRKSAGINHIASLLKIFYVLLNLMVSLS